MRPVYLYAIIILIMSTLTLILYTVDKKRARKNGWRIKEKTLLLCSILGGALGGIIALYGFRHKNKHWYFVVLNWGGLILQFGLGIFLAVKF